VNLTLIELSMLVSVFSSAMLIWLLVSMVGSNNWVQKTSGLDEGLGREVEGLAIDDGDWELGLLIQEFTG
jgi:hypothetical protein